MYKYKTPHERRLLRPPTCDKKGISEEIQDNAATKTRDSEPLGRGNRYQTDYLSRVHVPTRHTLSTKLIKCAVLILVHRPEAIEIDRKRDAHLHVEQK